MSMPENCAIVEKWEASILGQNLFCVRSSAAQLRPGLHGKIEAGEWFADLAEHPVIAVDHAIPR